MSIVLDLQNKSDSAKNRDETDHKVSIRICHLRILIKIQQSGRPHLLPASAFELISLIPDSPR